MSITKATRDVLDLATRTVIALDVNCTGTNLIDNVEIGSRVPNAGTFTDVIADTVTMAANGTLDVSDTGVTVVGKLRAYYADVAEKYAADRDYAPGTVLEFGGECEVTESRPGSTRLAGVMTSDPFIVLNEKIVAKFPTTIALVGRIPCRVWGPVRAGDIIVASLMYGIGTAAHEGPIDPTQVIGRAIKACTRIDERLIEIKVGL